jgi:Tfp pilus assembly protein FimV
MRTTSTAPSVRLTRRGRAVLVLLLSALLLAAFSIGQRDTQAASVGTGSGASAPTATTVQPGESLWSVAQRIAPENDPREVIAQIRRLNDLQSSQLQVGQHLLLPTAA